ncbi:MAG: Co2+/Mg2+ efflux protein ApaG [Pseudomonadota bacterium]|nr:Co2+/Mg2+ efflux protein ApaG [Pseudomonadota bacterium]
MYSALTQQIRVTVRPEFSTEQSEPSDDSYFWVYTVEIANQGEKSVRLLHRHWRITDALGHLETVDGPGVVGEQPTIAPGQAFRYSSGCPLKTPSGFMTGSYDMIDEAGQSFEVEIPAFSLDSPFLRRVLN